MVKSPTKKVNGYYLLFHQFCSIGRSCISIKTNSENYTLPKQQQQYPMALDDTPNTILQSPKLLAHVNCSGPEPPYTLNIKFSKMKHTQRRQRHESKHLEKRL